MKQTDDPILNAAREKLGAGDRAMKELYLAQINVIEAQLASQRASDRLSRSFVSLYMVNESNQGPAITELKRETENFCRMVSQVNRTIYTPSRAFFETEIIAATRRQLSARDALMARIKDQGQQGADRRHDVQLLEDIDRFCEQRLLHMHQVLRNCYGMMLHNASGLEKVVEAHHTGAGDASYALVDLALRSTTTNSGVPTKGKKKGERRVKSAPTPIDKAFTNAFATMHESLAPVTERATPASAPPVPPRRTKRPPRPPRRFESANVLD